MGGAWFHDLFGDPDKVDPDWLASVAMETLRSQIGLSAKPTYCRVNLCKDCIPNYRLNHHKLVGKFQAFPDFRIFFYKSPFASNIFLKEEKQPPR